MFMGVDGPRCVDSGQRGEVEVGYKTFSWRYLIPQVTPDPWTQLMNWTKVEVTLNALVIPTGSTGNCGSKKIPLDHDVRF